MTIIGSQDVDTAVSLCTKALQEVAHLDWTVPAAGLEWNCYDTAVHVAEDFTAYAAQLTVRASEGYVPLEVRADEGTTPDGLIQMITASGGFLSAVTAVARPDDRAWHPYGNADATGFAAMGVVEVLLHTHDILGGLGVHDWEPGPELPARVLDRLFPHIPRGTDAWRTLLWATGRGELPGLARKTVWRWYADPVAAERVLLCPVLPAVAADLVAGGAGGFDWAADGPADGTRRAAGSVVKAHEEGRYRRGWGPYVIVRASDRRAIGGMGFHGVPDADGRAEMGYDLVPSARGNGYATEALKALTGWALRQPGLTLLTATIDEDNAASHAVVRRVGFTEAGSGEGTIRYALR
ncbi:GNAT family N-acetyltransferase [Streptomyces sp. NBC_00503]|uniref:GNAT family N-acetyltransferase n=1 Tax=Streptomyces sp. NBC_00503 TaxID=2903659 RepID=UPI002E805501|nr:GNAT family N-acetyltransferase [Streptomyces sp. NBC_00503]WUD85130.1 GNAT family N-acetyltransferase [Streptomyces sp. NBC_00503]